MTTQEARRLMQSTSLENALLAFLASGMTTQEIAARTEMALVELDIALTVMMRRYGALTLPHLVALRMARA